MERQTRVTDFIPRSYGALALWFVLGAGLIAGLEALYFYMPRIPIVAVDGRIAAFELGAHGSLSAWYSSLLLQTAAAAALVVYSIRKQRASDYHAHYRIWFAAAFGWFVMSVDTAAGLHHGFQGLMIALTGERGFGDGSVWWIGAYGLVLGLIGLRLVLDMKECRTSTTLFVLTGICYVASIVAHLGFVPFESDVQAVMIEAGLVMAGHLLLLMSMTVHARYVFLEAKGEITARPTKSKKEKSKPTKEDAVVEEKKSSMLGWLRKAKIDAPHGTPAPAGRTSDLEPAKSERVSSSVFRPTTETYESGTSSRAGVKKVQADFSDDDEDDRRDNRKLSKAERKNLRRQKDLERRYGLSDE